MVRSGWPGHVGGGNTCWCWADPFGFTVCRDYSPGFSRLLSCSITKLFRWRAGGEAAKDMPEGKMQFIAGNRSNKDKKKERIITERQRLRNV